ncbi:hypothetical protein, partial [Kitasatospora sp. NPDC047058]|uniref:hypothetical protein n=1 Tax=Kitasatospora sp. NPDC047058 TaxID=3155620 RepID=UPI0033D6B6A9
MGHRSSELRRRRQKRSTRRTALIGLAVAAGLVGGVLGIQTVVNAPSHNSAVASADGLGAGQMVGLVTDDDGETGSAESGTKAPAAPKRDTKA